MSGCWLLPEAAVTRVGTLPTSAQPQGFWSGVAVWVDKPHVVNRRLTGAKEVARIWTNNAVIREMVQGHRAFLTDELSETTLQKKLEELQISRKNEALEDTVELIVRDLLPRQLERAKVVREIVILDHSQTTAWFIPLGSSRHEEQGEEEGSELSYKSYRFVYSADDSGTGKMIGLDILSPAGGSVSDSPADDGICNPTTKWLCEHLLPKITHWSEQEGGDKGEGGRRRVQYLVPIDQYNVLYQQLKKKYGKKMIQIWPDVTTTDPEKFVYEDIAIATYLLLLWEEERRRLGLQQKQSFVDLGCGNGLLVHLLSQEGHPGKGIDVRKRTTWDIYGPDTVLQEEPITPSDSCLFPDHDWLIGNHSDELTPWIPVIAARSSYSTRYFVLPCCPYDFHGKFARTHTANSHYRNYLDYVRQVGEACGFTVEEDSLRIPSTKRICQIGQSRCYLEHEKHKIDEQIKTFISSRPREHPRNSQKCQTEVKRATEYPQGDGNTLCDDPSTVTPKQHMSRIEGTTGSGSALWVESFQPRNKVEVVRNCNRLEEGLKEKIVNTVGLALLSQHSEEEEKEGEQTNKQTNMGCKKVVDGKVEDHLDGAKAAEKRPWNKGGSLQMSEVVSMFDKELLQKLKCECGGLKTLLKNKNQVFILRGDSVKLRDWSVEEPIEEKHTTSTNRKKGKKKKKTDRELRVKTSLCWFYIHHPDGCPRRAEDCYYAHGPGELRDKPQAAKKSASSP